MKTLMAAMLLLSLLVAAGRTYAEVTPQRIYAIGRAAPAPKIDGDISDECWTSLPKTTGFTRIMTSSGPAKAQTFARIGRTSTHLVVAIRCMEGELEAACRAAKVAGNFERESVEIFIDRNLDRRTYGQFRINILGRRDARWGFEPRADKWADKWQGAVAFEKDAWTVEVAIPFSLIGPRPGVNSRWGFNLARQRSISDPFELSCWSDTGRRGFHKPDRFGQVIFRPFAEWLDAAGKDRLASVAAQVEAMAMDYPRSLADGRTLGKQLQELSAIRAKSIDSVRTETDMLSAMRVMATVDKESDDILRQARLAVIRGEFK